MSDDGSYIVESMTVGWWTAPVGNLTREELTQRVAELAPAYTAMAEERAPGYVAGQLGYTPEIVRIESNYPDSAFDFITNIPVVAVKMKVFYKVRP